VAHEELPVAQFRAARSIFVALTVEIQLVPLFSANCAKFAVSVHPLALSPFQRELPKVRC
jgi:hypothetical protein